MSRKVATHHLKLLASATARRLRKTDDRFLYWAVYYPFNFGDWIGPFLYQRIVGRDPWHAPPDSLSLGTVFMSAGSILSEARSNCVVWGSGIISRGAEFERPHRIDAVRGPITRTRCLELGIPCPELYGDPAILLPRYYRPRSASRDFRLGVVPHYTQFAEVASRYTNDTSVRVIDVRHPIEDVIDAINTCQFVASSSLHGLIVANAYGVPALWTVFGDTLAGDNTKFFDYFESIGCHNPPRLAATAMPPPQVLIEAASKCQVYDIRPLADALDAACPFPRRPPAE